MGTNSSGTQGNWYLLYCYLHDIVHLLHLCYCMELSLPVCFDEQRIAVEN